MLIALSTSLHLIAAIAFLCTILLSLVFKMYSVNHEVPSLSDVTNLKNRILFLQRISFGLLIFTGLYLMLEDSNYIGWFSVRNLWSLLLLVKHTLIIILLFLLVVSSVIVKPLYGQSKLNEDAEMNRDLYRWEIWSPKVQLLIAVFILLISTSLVIQ